MLNEQDFAVFDRCEQRRRHARGARPDDDDVITALVGYAVEGDEHPAAQRDAGGASRKSTIDCCNARYMSVPVEVGQPSLRAASTTGDTVGTVITQPTKVDGASFETSTGRGSPTLMPAGVALATRSKPAGSGEQATTLALPSA